jgi:hypothetical protein
MTNEPASTLRARRLRERRSRGVVMVAPVEVGEGGVGLLVRNGLLKQHQINDRHAVGEACLAALEQWAEGTWCTRSTVHGPRDRARGSDED